MFITFDPVEGYNPISIAASAIESVTSVDVLGHACTEIGCTSGNVYVVQQSVSNVLESIEEVLSDPDADDEDEAEE